MKISSNENEVQLIRHCKRGNAKAQYRLYKLYSKAMYNIAIRMTGNSKTAEDILQDSFIKAFTDLHKLNDEKAFGGWLKRIVINTSIDVVRKEKFIFLNVETLSGQHFEIEDQQEESVNPEIVHHFIKRLPDGARQILVLHALEGLKHAEIGEQLGISESTVKTQFFRAKQLLGKMIKESDYEIRNRKIPGKNRSKLDADEPNDDLIWQGIKSGLKEKNQFFSPWFWKVAAIFFLVIFTTYVVINESKQEQVVNVTLSDVSKSLGKQESGLKQQVDIKWKEVQSKMTNENIDIQFLLKEYSELDKIYLTYQNDLGKTPDNERIIRAILDQYEKKIQILNRLLLEIEKQKNHEKTITL